MKDADWGKCYDKYEKLALRVAWQLLYSLDDVQDVVQEAASAAWARRKSLEDALAFKALFVGAVVNQCRKRRREYSRGEESETSSPAPAGASGGPAEAVERQEMLRRARAAMAALPREQSEAVTLCLIEDLSYDEAAKVLGLTVPALRNNLYRARKALRDALEDVLG